MSIQSHGYFSSVLTHSSNQISSGKPSLIIMIFLLSGQSWVSSHEWLEKAVQLADIHRRCIQHPISVSWFTSMNLKREGGVAVSLNPSVVPDCGVVSAHLCCMMEKCFQKIKERTAESRLKAVVCFNISDVRPLILFEKRLFTAQLQSRRLCLVGPAPVWSQCY